jgi:hypothetical protein
MTSWDPLEFQILALWIFWIRYNVLNPPSLQPVIQELSGPRVWGSVHHCMVRVERKWLLSLRHLESKESDIDTGKEDCWAAGWRPGMMEKWESWAHH